MITRWCRVGRRPNGTNRGQALVEFALILPVLAALLLTVLDLGRLFYSQMVITNAAREGALQASLPVSPTPGGVFDANHVWYVTPSSACDPKTDAVTCRALLEFQGASGNWFVQPLPTDVTLACVPATEAKPTSCPNGMSNGAAVTVRAPFTLWSPWMAAFFGGQQTLTLTATAISQVQTLPVTAPRVPVTATTGSIVAAKNAVGGTGTFTFTGTGTGVPPSFTITTTTSDSSSTSSAGSALFTSLAPGNYTVSEQSSSGWTFNSLSCFTSGPYGSSGVPDGSTPTQADITLKAGDAVICTFTNTLSPVCSTPSAGFTATNGGTTYSSGSGATLSGPTPLQVNFTDTSTASASCPIWTWKWNFGDGSTSTQQNPKHNFNQTGSYTVQLTVTNSAGTSTSGSITVTATK